VGPYNCDYVEDVERGGSMAGRAFLSFEMEDRWARDFLVGQVRNRGNDLEFVDYSVHEPFDEKWKTNCRERIARTAGSIVLIGPTTSSSPAVLWEIAETTRQGHPMFGIQITSDKTYPTPEGLPRAKVVRWTFDSIVRELGQWA
jgi:hypothetical protein